MKKIWFPTLFAASFAAAFGTFTLGAHLLCDHFKESDIHPTLGNCKTWQTDPGDYPEEIFKQSYHYLGKGSQSTVFESEDRQYVIKFFRRSRLTAHIWSIGPTFMQEIYQAKQREKQKERWNLFSSCYLAFTELKAECGLIYLHLNKSHKLPTLLLYDRLQRPHFVNLNQVAFYIQKRAEPLMQRISHAPAKETMREIALLLKKRMDRGIDDHDPVLQKNTGFIGNQAIFIDIGSFYPNPATKENQYESVYKMTRKLARLLNEKKPDLSTELDEAIKILILQ